MSADYRQTINRYIDRLSTDCQPSIDRVSTEYRPSVNRLSTDISVDTTYSKQDPMDKELYNNNDMLIVITSGFVSPAGGGYLSGAGAQEENLFRRTNYVQHLADPDNEFDPERKWSYRLPEFSCVYSTNVFIIRAAEAEGYAFLRKPIAMSFVALSAYCSPALTKDKQRLIPQVAENTKRKIRCMLATGLYHDHDSLVLSALGCGAFRNPPRHMAELFKEVLEEDEFANKYKHISFAIIDDHNARREGNYQPFKEVFSQ